MPLQNMSFEQLVNMLIVPALLATLKMLVWAMVLSVFFGLCIGLVLALTLARVAFAKTLSFIGLSISLSV